MTQKKYTRRPPFIPSIPGIVEVASEMCCPECGTSMYLEESHGVTIDRCRKCGGLWFDLEEIFEYVRKTNPDSGYHPSDDDFQNHTKDSGTTCTCCGEKALEFGSTAGVSFQRCTWCGGVYVKEKELAHLVRSEVREGGVGAEIAFGVLELLGVIVDIVGEIG